MLALLGKSLRNVTKKKKKKSAFFSLSLLRRSPEAAWRRKKEKKMLLLLFCAAAACSHRRKTRIYTKEFLFSLGLAEKTNGPETAATSTTSNTLAGISVVEAPSRILMQKHLMLCLKP